ncbi:MAG: formyltetrahydrofolate deformylase [Betaproteobacteria bacterium]|nr:formyltetrahydrofolate deformylase [Betaproteobacteria bacterium]
MTSSFVLTLSCPDRAGIVHAVSGFLFERGANIVEAAQFGDVATGLFFMRVQFELAGAASTLDTAGRDPIAGLRAEFEPVAQQFSMRARIVELSRRLPTVIMVSKLGHCLNDLLFRWRSGLLPLDIRAIVSNHRDFYQMAASYDIAFHHLPVTPDTKAEAEARLLDVVRAERVELVVLARYMQVLSPSLCAQLEGRAINIHHSFLPSFKGARPYQQAHDRGVKLIGATAHYVTTDLDEGPIIEQDAARVDHTMDVATLTAIGRDVESVVLARALKWHAEHRVLINGSKTVVFR